MSDDTRTVAIGTAVAGAAVLGVAAYVILRPPKSGATAKTQVVVSPIMGARPVTTPPVTTNPIPSTAPTAPPVLPQSGSPAPAAATSPGGPITAPPAQTQAGTGTAAAPATANAPTNAASAITALGLKPGQWYSTGGLMYQVTASGGPGTQGYTVEQYLDLTDPTWRQKAATLDAQMRASGMVLVDDGKGNRYYVDKTLAQQDASGTWRPKPGVTSTSLPANYTGQGNGKWYVDGKEVTQAAYDAAMKAKQDAINKQARLTEYQNAQAEAQRLIDQARKGGRPNYSLADLQREVPNSWVVDALRRGQAEFGTAPAPAPTPAPAAQSAPASAPAPAPAPKPAAAPTPAPAPPPSPAPVTNQPKPPTMSAPIAAQPVTPPPVTTQPVAPKPPVPAGIRMV